MKYENQVYTTSFYTTNLIPDNYEAVSIALSSPSFFYGKEEKCFMPTWELINGIKNGILTEEEYTSKYLDLIYSRREEVMKVIEKLKDKKVVYLCHEPKGKFCHRHIVSLLLSKFDIECHEL